MFANDKYSSSESTTAPLRQGDFGKSLLCNYHYHFISLSVHQEGKKLLVLRLRQGAEQSDSPKALSVRLQAVDQDGHSVKPHALALLVKVKGLVPGTKSQKGLLLIIIIIIIIIMKNFFIALFPVKKKRAQCA